VVIRRRSLCAFVFVCTLVTLPALHSAEPLFPVPLHLVRRIDDPLAGHTITLNEYCAGDRIVTVNGSRTTIVDYGRQEITEIDHRAATYSITRFSEVTGTPAAPSAPSASEWKVTAVGVRASAAGRAIDAFEMTRALPGGTEKIEAAVDRRITLSRAASEALIGAADPGRRSTQHDALLHVASGKSTAAATADVADRYGLIAEQIITIEEEGIRIVVRNSIIASDSATVPPDALLIDPGSRRVESRMNRIDRELRDIDRLPAKPAKP
jgi:hypothetical protein